MNILSELRDDVRSHKLIPGLMVGSLTGAMLVGTSLVMATLVFRGPLAPFVAQGTGMVLFGNFVMCLVLALTSGYRGAMSVSLNVTAMMIATIGAKLVAGMRGVDGQTLFMTMAAVMILTTLVSGLCSFLLGKYRLANLFRYIPFPVTSGLLAAAGCLLALAALGMMSGASLTWRTLPRWFEPTMLAKVASGVAFFVALLLILKFCRRWNGAVVIAAGTVLGTGLYHLGLFLLGVSLDDARDAGVLGMAQQVVWPSFALGDLIWVDWSSVTLHLPHIVTVILMALVGLLVRVTGLEEGVGAELDLDREFVVAGAAGALASLGGSLPGCHALSESLIARRHGAETRLTGISAALIVGVVLFLGIRILALVPLPLLGGLLLLFAVDLLKPWLIDVFKRVTWADYSIVLLTFAAVVCFGFLIGVGVGLGVTTVFFAIRLSRAELIAAMATGRELHSRKARSIPDRAVLHDQGRSLRVYRLRGHIFFGSAHPVVRRIRKTLGTAPPACILLDFGMVSGFDIAAVNTFCQFIRSAHAEATRVVISAASRLFRDDLERMLGDDSRDLVHFEADLDRGLEWCEDRIIGAVGRDPDAFGGLLDRVGEAMERQLDRQASFEELVDELAPWLEPRTYRSGETLSARPDAEGLQLLVTGRVSTYDADGVRLSQHGPGYPVDKEAAFGAPGPPVSTRAELPCRTALLTPVANGLLEQDAPDLSLKLYRYLITAPVDEPSRHDDVPAQGADPLLAGAPLPLPLHGSRTAASSA